jgi:hypothetical protein
MGSDIEAITHRNPHPFDYFDYFKLVEAVAILARTFWWGKVKKMYACQQSHYTKSNQIKSNLFI